MKEEDTRPMARAAAADAATACTREGEEGEDEFKLQRFSQWLQANGGELRGCAIRRCSAGFGVFATAVPAGNNGDGVVLVVPLELAITPMRVLQDPVMGARCRALFEEDGGLDDRLLVMMFLMVERLRPESTWKPYLDMLPSTFRSSLWFSDDELSELKGTTLYRATVLQKKALQALFYEKVKILVEEFLCAFESTRMMEVAFEDFLWANSIFWTRALNIPFPHSFVFPKLLDGQENNNSCQSKDSHDLSKQNHGNITDRSSCRIEDCSRAMEETSGPSESKKVDPVWVEGLVPGIDFCNHDLKALATWEVDPLGDVCGLGLSMYLVIADQKFIEIEKEIYINYGNKGNEELLYLYGFVMDDNPDDYIMVNYPVDALQNVHLFERKGALLQLQKAELRCLLSKRLLDRGFFSSSSSEENVNNQSASHLSNFSWSGQRRAPSYLKKMVFPQEFITALRTIAMQEHELNRVNSLLEELAGSEEGRQFSDTEVQAAVWEVCGDHGALELLVDLLHVKKAELEEGTGTEDSDGEILGEFRCDKVDEAAREIDDKCKSSYRSSLVYRKGQKELARLFLQEAEHALELSAQEELKLKHTVVNIDPCEAESVDQNPKFRC